MKRIILSTGIAFGILSFVLAGTTQQVVVPANYNVVQDTIPERDTIPKRDTTDIPDIPDTLSVTGIPNY